MARIPEDEIERLKREVPLARVVASKGVVLKKHGDNLIGRCPFHDDKTPSLVVTPGKNLWHCMGACQVGGSVIDFVMRAEGVSFRLAVEMLRKDIPSLVAASGSEGVKQPPKRATTVKLDSIAEPDEVDGVVLERVLAHYTVALTESPDALGYLKERGLDHPRLVEHFRLGFANRTLGYRLPRANRAAGEALRGQLTRLGIYRESGHEHFNGSVTVPIFDEAGELSQMYGRRVGRPKEGPLHLYMSRPHTSVWNVSALRESQDVILCEALFDALTFWCAGYTNVISSYGVEGFTAGHLAALKTYGTTKVLIAYDRDEAGERASAKLASELSAHDLTVFRVVFPRNMDANEYALKVAPAAKSLGTALRSAQWMAGSRAVQVPPVPEVEREPLPPLAAGRAAPGPTEISALEVATASPAVPESSPASPTAAAAGSERVTNSKLAGGEVTLRFGERTWRLRGLEKVTSVSSMKVNLRTSVGGAFFMDSFDVCQARVRAAFTKQAAEELGVEERLLKLDLGRVLNELEVLVEAQLRKTLEPTKRVPTMSEAEQAAALSLLRDPQLLDRILGDFEKCGVVGEETNKLVAYLAAVSRKLEEPLAIVIQSSSAAGKSALMDAVLRFVPEEEQVSYSAMTGQSLFYMGATDLQHKVLGIAEEEGATNAAYALKILQSSGELTIASTGKDPATGRLVTQEYRVTGPVMVMLTTTSIEIDEELLNRCLVLTVDEGAAQTQAIQRMQRESRTLEGMRAKLERGQVMQLQQNAQRLLKPMAIVNPYAPELSFASHATRTRRDHKKYLALIDAIALLHQHQRAVKTAQVGTSTLHYIEVTREDVALANKLASRVLARGLDELAPQTRRVLEVVQALVAERAEREGVEPGEVRFTQRDVRVYTGWGGTQLKMHLKTLQELEYVVTHRSGHSQRFVYELCVSGAGEAVPSPFEQPAYAYDANRSGSSADRSATGRGAKRPVLARDSAGVSQPVGESSSALTGVRVNGASYVHPRSEPPAAAE